MADRKTQTAASDRDESRAGRSDRNGTTSERTDPRRTERTDEHGTLSALHGELGNQAVQTLAERGTLQPKLRVSTPSDPAEREAERVAEQVTGATEAPRATPVAEQDGTEATDGQQSTESLEGRIDRATDSTATGRSSGPAESRIPRIDQSVGAGGRPNAGAVTDEPLERALRTTSAGRPLPTAARATLEPAFGLDFGDVRIHTDPEAATLSRSLGARAFTHGSDVYFDAGEYRPGTRTGTRLLAHELTHVVQQRERSAAVSTASPGPGVIQRQGSTAGNESGTGGSVESFQTGRPWWKPYRPHGGGQSESGSQGLSELDKRLHVADARSKITRGFSRIRYGEFRERMEAETTFGSSPTEIGLLPFLMVLEGYVLTMLTLLTDDQHSRHMAEDLTTDEGGNWKDAKLDTFQRGEDKALEVWNERLSWAERKSLRSSPLAHDVIEELNDRRAKVKESI